jgi:glycosyltransferase involved in cell wall biosynthesis
MGNGIPVAIATAGAPAGAASARRILVQPGRNSFPDMTSFVVERIGFELIQLADYDSHRAQSKWTHLRGLARQSLDLIRWLPRLRNCRCVITIGPVSHGHLLKLLKRLRIVNYRQSITLGWYIHSPRWFPLLRLLTKLDGPDDQYILFSDWEIELYRMHLGIDPSRMHWLPYGEWGPPPKITEITLPDNLPDGGYYFAGGYSNRDYVPLIAAFRKIGAPLLIICSALNTELDNLDLPHNVTILRDVPAERFEAYVRQAKACIIPLKRDTGASGQSVTLRSMRNGKAIITNDFGGVRDYIIDGVSGYLVADMARDLPGIVATIERDPAAAERLGEAAHQRYCDYFSPESGAAALARILSPLLA